MSRQRAVAVVVVVVGVLAVVAVVGLTLYGRSQPALVDTAQPDFAWWFQNGIEHLINDGQDRTDEINASIESPAGQAFFQDVVAPIVLGVCVVAGVGVVVWLMIDHRRRQRS